MQKMLFVFLLVLPLALLIRAPAQAEAGLSPDTSQKIIFNGEGRPGAAPLVLDQAITRSTVFLIVEHPTYKSVCTGTVIARHLVLTAAHCVSDEPRSITVAFYENPEKFVARDARKYVVHPNYDAERSKADLALIYFKGSIPAGHSAAKLLRTPRAYLDSYFLGVRNPIAGYGVTSYGQGDVGGLRTTQLSFDDYYNDMIVLVDHEYGSSACSGDSGGPAFIWLNGEYRVWGVAASVDMPFCRNHSLYTDVTQHLEWIDRTSKRLVRSVEGH